MAYESQTYEAILKRMLDSIPSDIDKREGSIIYDAVAPAAVELAQMYAELDTNMALSFAETASGEYLERRAAEFGVIRKLAVKAKRKGFFYDSLDNPFDVPLNSRYSISGINYVVVEQLAAGQFTLECETAGVVGNQYFGDLIPIDYIAGLGKAELTDVLTSGTDIESEESLRSRYLQKVRSPSAGGNKADYVNWALETTGVGGVSVVPVRDGSGTVSIAIIDSSRAPASQTLIDQVQDYIAPPWRNETEAEAMTISGYGVSIDDTQSDDTGNSLLMVYDAGGTGMVTHSEMHALLQQPGIWQARVNLKVDDNAGTNDLLQIGVWNISSGRWALVDPSGTADAVQTLQADDIATSFGDIIQEFYWNGQDQLELRITRLQTDIITMVWIDKVKNTSTFSKDNGEGKAPVGAKVTVESATAVTISLSATLTIASGYNIDSVKAAVQQNIADYIKSLAFTDDNDVRYVRIGQAILDTTGVQDYQNLLVNGGLSNITIGTQEVAVLGTVTLT